MENSREAEVLHLLTEQRAELQEDLAKYISGRNETKTDTDDEGYSDTPVLDNVLQSGGVGTVVEVTNYSLNWFYALWSYVREKV